MKGIFGELGNFLMDFVETLIMAAAIFIVVYLFLLQPHQVRGQSMFPTFEDSEFILTDKITYRFRGPERGDVVVFKSPQDGNFDFIKRIIALPAENIKISSGHFYIYNLTHTKGDLLEEPYIDRSVNTPPGSIAREGEVIKVPENQYFVSGDNRTHSSDSREWGTVPKESIIGRAWLRYWPLSKFGLIHQVDYKL